MLVLVEVFEVRVPLDDGVDVCAAAAAVGVAAAAAAAGAAWRDKL